MNLSSSLATISSSFKLAETPRVKAQLRMSFHHTHILFIDGDPHVWKNHRLSLLLFLSLSASASLPCTLFTSLMHVCVTMAIPR